MGTIRKRKSKRGNVYYAEVRQKNSKSIGKTFLKRTNATRWIKEVEYQLDKQTYVDFRETARLTLGDLLKRYRDQITPKKKSGECETFKLNLMLRHKIAKKRLLDLRTKDVLDFKNEIKINDGKYYPRAASTINKYVHYVYTVWETAKLEWDITLPHLNPASLVKKEKVNDKIDRILTIDEYQNLLEACSKSNLSFLFDMTEFAYITAMRFGEITKLKTIDVDFTNRLAKLRDTKNGEDRIVPLTNRALEIANKYRFKDKLFKIHRDKFRHYFEQACKRADVKNFRFHDLRACAITNLFLDGWSIAEVSVVSGHKTWSELKRYTRIQPTDLVKKINKEVS
jgi:integrase|tara:strand:- start:50 stop:1069 length:1020 start_codon:yes stop_codon:yes gene_type:complete